MRKTDSHCDWLNVEQRKHKSGYNHKVSQSQSGVVACWFRIHIHDCLSTNNSHVVCRLCARSSRTTSARRRSDSTPHISHAARHHAHLLFPADGSSTIVRSWRFHEPLSRFHPYRTSHRDSPRFRRRRDFLGRCVSRSTPSKTIAIFIPTARRARGVSHRRCRLPSLFVPSAAGRRPHPSLDRCFRTGQDLWRMSTPSLARVDVDHGQKAHGRHHKSTRDLLYPQSHLAHQT